MFHSLRYLILSITSRCNIRCKYCHQAAGDMGLDMSCEIVDKSLQLADNKQPLFIQITGGEPTLAPEIIERIARKSQLMKVRPHLAIQTNGTLLTPALVKLFRKYQMQVGLSIDGPPAIQEELRGKTADTLLGIGLLEEAGIHFRVTTVVTNENILSLDKLALMLSGFRNCRGIGLDLLVAKGRGTSLAVSSPSREHLHKGISGLVQTLTSLNNRRKNPILLREMELVKKGSSSNTFCHAASGKSLAVQADGSLYLCGQTIGDSSFHCGSVFTPSYKQDSPLTTLLLQAENCNSCSLKNCCPGDCPSRIHYNGEKESNLICELYRCIDALL